MFCVVNHYHLLAIITPKPLRLRQKKVVIPAKDGTQPTDQAMSGCGDIVVNRLRF